MNKVFWSHFKYFGRLLEKNYLFLTPSKTDGRSSQPARCTHNQQTYDKHYQTLPASLGMVIRQNSAPQWRRWGKAEVSDKKQISAIVNTKSPQTPRIVSLPATLCFQAHINFPKSPSQQKIAWRTDILRNRFIGCPWIYNSDSIDTVSASVHRGLC